MSKRRQRRRRRMAQAVFSPLSGCPIQRTQRASRLISGHSARRLAHARSLARSTAAAATAATAATAAATAAASRRPPTLNTTPARHGAARARSCARAHVYAVWPAFRAKSKSRRCRWPLLPPPSLAVKRARLFLSLVGDGERRARLMKAASFRLCLRHRRGRRTEVVASGGGSRSPP